MTETIHRPNLLKRAFLCNAAFSTITGGTMALAPGAIAAAIGLPWASLVFLTGAGLLLFAGYLVWLSRIAELPAVSAWLVVAGDLVWVVASFAGLALFFGDIPTIGKWLISGAADVVLAFALLQSYAIARPMPGTEAQPSA